MPILPAAIAGIFPWLVGLLGSLVSSIATFLIGRVAVERAFQIALVSAFLVASAGLFVTLALGVKALLLGARVAMPGSLGQATYFLPASINLIFATIVTIRVGASVYRWTVATMAAYLPGNSTRHMML